MARILVVDDDSGMRAFLSAVLTAGGYDVSQAANAQQAMKALVEQHIDLALLDIWLPGKNGTELLHELHEWSTNLPVVMITGMPSVSTAVECLKEGARDFLEKPVSPDKLLETVAQVLRKPQSTDDTMVADVAQVHNLVSGYRVLRRLGRGGQADVFLAERQESLNGDPLKVALKLLQFPDGGNTPESRTAIERFAREAQLAMSLSHPRIVKVLDFGIADDGNTPYLAMEYMPGRAIKDKIPELSKRSWEDKMTIVLHVAEALMAIHELGSTHRDVKPHNILQGETFEFKLTDFGTARVSNSQLTATNACMGTPSYMAPEAFSGMRVDHRTDIFSLGVTAYELCFNALPFTGHSLPALARSICGRRPTDPRKVAPNVPPPIVHILAMLLKKSRQQRYQTAATVVGDLQAFLNGHPLPSLSGPTPPESDGMEQEPDWS